MTVEGENPRHQPNPNGDGQHAEIKTTSEEAKSEV